MDGNSSEADIPPPAKPIRLSDPESGFGAEPQLLAAEFHCLLHVDHYATGGFRDTVAQVRARWREVYRHVEIEVPRTRNGVRRFPFVCPMCGKGVEFQTRSWLRTNLGPLSATILLGVVLATIGYFNIPAHGKIGVGIAIAGLAIAAGLPLLALLVPGLVDTIPSALQIAKDVPRDPSMFPMPGTQCLHAARYEELAGAGQNQHKLVNVRRVRRG
jgi:hypothetical protein